MSDASMSVCVILSFLLFLLYIFYFNLSALQADIAFRSMEVITFVIGNLTILFSSHPLQKQPTIETSMPGSKLD